MNLLSFLDLEVAFASFCFLLPVGAFEDHTVDECALVFFEFGLLDRVELGDHGGNTHAVEGKSLLSRDDLCACGQELQRVEETGEPDALWQWKLRVRLDDVSPLLLVVDAHQQVAIPSHQGLCSVVTLFLPNGGHFAGHECNL